MSTQSEVEQFFAGGPPRPEVVNGRHKFVGPDGVERSYQRASNFAFPLVDQYGLNKHRMRQLLLGVAQRPDLMAVLATMDVADPDRTKLDEVIETATQVAGSTAAANLGTAIHSALQAADEGKPYPPEYEKYVQAYRAELARNGLTVVAVERMVVYPVLGAAGRTDRVYQEADGTYVIGDAKSTDHLELGAHEISVQLAVYQGASHIRTADGKGWEEFAGKVRDDYAIVVHVDRETGAVSLYRVDLLIGRHGANLAEQIRGWRKSGPVLLPYVPPAQTGKWVGPGNLHRGPDGVLFDGPTMPMAEVERQYAQPPVNERPLTAPSPFDGPTVTGPPVSDTVRAELSELDGSAEGESNADALTAMAIPQYDENGDEQPTYTIDEVAELTGTAVDDVVQRFSQPPAIGLKTAAELLKAATTKATVQQYCRDHGITEDLAHNKKILVEKLRKAGQLAGEQPAATPPSAPAPAQSAGGPPPPTGNPEDPRDVAFLRLHLARIKVAATVGELHTIRETVIRAGGEQAWTAEMTEAARERVAELDLNTTHDVLNRIGLAQTSEDLGKLWEEVTVGNTLVSAWEPYKDAALRRLDEINASRPPAPANPFAS